MIRAVLPMLLALTALLAVTLPAQAQVNILPEVRAGLSARGVTGTGNLLDPTRITDANVELLFAAPDLNAWAPLGELRPHLGATLNFRGQDSYGYAGLSWTFAAPVIPVFAEASLGAVARTSLFNAPQGDPARNPGCGFGARAAASLGVNLPAGTSLIATLEHLPDFGTCGAPARDNTNISLRLGFRF
jgi:lipid A 3-O-deacylase